MTRLLGSLTAPREPPFSSHRLQKCSHILHCDLVSFFCTPKIKENIIQHVCNKRGMILITTAVVSIDYIYIMLPEHCLHQVPVKCLTFPKTWLNLKLASCGV
jgi:hypothetical protein